jgi:hypothetical protein
VTAPVVAAALLFWAGVFMVYFTAASTTPVEFFFGRYEPLPEDLGVWRETGTAESGLLREERCVLPDGRQSSGHLLRQVRFRDAVTREIVSVEPERRLPRRRVSSRSRA